MYAVEKKFSFEAAHYLTGLGDNHPCGCMHGHSYHGSLRVESETLNTNGFILDFSSIKKFVNSFIKKQLDHKVILCEKQIEGAESVDVQQVFVMPKEYTNTTAENFCKMISDKFVKFLRKYHDVYPETITVRLWETENNCAEYRLSIK